VRARSRLNHARASHHHHLFDLGATLGSLDLSPPPVHLTGFELFEFACQSSVTCGAAGCARA